MVCHLDEINDYSAFHLYSEVGFSEVKVGNSPPELGFPSWEVGQPCRTPSSKSNMAAPCINSSESNKLTKTKAVVINSLLAHLSYLCLTKSVVHTVLSHFYLCTCCYAVCMHKKQRNAFLLTGIANNG